MTLTYPEATGRALLKLTGNPPSHPPSIAEKKVSSELPNSRQRPTMTGKTTSSYGNPRSAFAAEMPSVLAKEKCFSGPALCWNETHIGAKKGRNCPALSAHIVFPLLVSSHRTSQDHRNMAGVGDTVRSVP